MKFKLEQLDGRHSGHRIYTHRVWIHGTGVDRKRDYVQAREWCWETFGPGCERDLVWYNNSSSYSWAFHYDIRQESVYIYLKKELLTAFLLRWS
jgi:hypothetical protein